MAASGSHLWRRPVPNSAPVERFELARIQQDQRGLGLDESTKLSAAGCRRRRRRRPVRLMRGRRGCRRPALDAWPVELRPAYPAMHGSRPTFAATVTATARQRASRTRSVRAWPANCRGRRSGAGALDSAHTIRRAQRPRIQCRDALGLAGSLAALDPVAHASADLDLLPTGSPGRSMAFQFAGSHRPRSSRGATGDALRQPAARPLRAPAGCAPVEGGGRHAGVRQFDPEALAMVLTYPLAASGAGRAVSRKR